MFKKYLFSKVVALIYLLFVLGCTSINKPTGTMSSIEDFIINGTVLERYLGNADIVIIPANMGILTIGERAFSEATAKYITIPEGVITIMDRAFIACFSLTKIDLPNTLTYIGREAFYSCRNLMEINIPRGVVDIKSGTFAFCLNLKNINIPTTVVTIGNYAFNNCISLVDIIIPDSVINIGMNAFSNCNSLVSITIPNSITFIDDSVFSNCTSLTNITIPNNVVSIGEYAFYRCISLTNITIPNSVITIGEGAFDKCENLNRIIIPASVTSIIGPFMYCSSLAWISVSEDNNSYSSDFGVLFNKEKDILIRYPPARNGSSYAIPRSVNTVNIGAFYNCNILEAVIIPESVNSIGSFYDCNRLRTFIVSENNNYFSSLDGVLFNKSKTVLISYPYAKIEEIYVVPNSVTNIYSGAFGNIMNSDMFTPALCNKYLKTLILSRNTNFIDQIYMENLEIVYND